MVEKLINEFYYFLSTYLRENFTLPSDLVEILKVKILNNPLVDWLAALVISLLFYLFRKQLIKFLEYILKTISEKFENPLGAKFFKIFNEPITWKILLIGFTASYSVLKFPQFIDEIVLDLNTSLNYIIIGWIIILFLDFLHNFYTYKYDNDDRVDLKDTIVKFGVRLLKITTVIIIFILLLQTWGYDIRGLLASLGLVGMAIALAAKDTARHLFGSIMIFTDAPFKVGDWIKTPDVEGTIEDIGMRSTRVRTFAQALVSVPNGNLADSAILNWSKMDRRRIKMTLGLTYSTTSLQMKNILQEIRSLLKNDEDIHQQTIYVHFSEFAESSLGIFCYFFTKTTRWGEYMEVRERIYLEIMRIVEENGAAFAFPSHSIYIEENNTLAKDENV